MPRSLAWTNMLLAGAVQEHDECSLGALCSVRLKSVVLSFHSTSHKWGDNFQCWICDMWQRKYDKHEKEERSRNKQNAEKIYNKQTESTVNKERRPRTNEACLLARMEKNTWNAHMPNMYRYQISPIESIDWINNTGNPHPATPPQQLTINNNSKTWEKRYCLRARWNSLLLTCMEEGACWNWNIQNLNRPDHDDASDTRFK